MPKRWLRRSSAIPTSPTPSARARACGARRQRPAVHQPVLPPAGTASRSTRPRPGTSPSARRRSSSPCSTPAARAHADLAGRLLPGYDFVSPQRLSNDGIAARCAGQLSRRRCVRPRRLGRRRATSRARSPTPSARCAQLVARHVGDRHDRRRPPTTAATSPAWTGSARVLPVRVLGKCYGDDADTADAIMWAAGLPVPGVPRTRTPAHVINLSLGDPGPCPQLHAGRRQRRARARRHARDRGRGRQPEQRRRSLSVGVRRRDLGRRVGAPTAAKARLLELRRAHRHRRARWQRRRQRSTNFLTLSQPARPRRRATRSPSRAGTSFSAPLVSGVVSLMLAVAPGLSASQRCAILKAQRQALPAGEQLPHARLRRRHPRRGRRGARARRPPPAARCARTMVEYYNAAARSLLHHVGGRRDRAARRRHRDQGLAAHRASRSRRCWTPALGAAARVPHLHSTRPGRRPLLRARRGRVRADAGAASGVRARGAGVLLPVSRPTAGACAGGDRARLSRVLQSRRTPIIATPPSAPCATRWWRAAGSPRATAPIAS